MLGVVLVMHETLADAMLECVRHVMGSVPDGLVAVNVPASEDVEHTVARVRDQARKVNAGSGVVFLTDLFGATPSNAAVRAGSELTDVPSVLVSGVNLPMLVRALGFRELSVSQVAERLVMGGRNGIVSTGATAPQRQTFNPAESDDSARNQHQQ